MVLYREDIMERWRFPRHRGALEYPDAQAETVNVFCGDEIALFLGLDAAKERIARARFSGEGCALMTASADILCEALEGRALADARAFGEEDLLKLYGEAPTPGRLGCVLLGHRALGRALATL